MLQVFIRSGVVSSKLRSYRRDIILFFFTKQVGYHTKQTFKMKKNNISCPLEGELLFIHIYYIVHSAKTNVS
jgi:hypothetical protein